MKQRLLFFVSVLLMIITVTSVEAQKTMDVTKFSRLDNDLTARMTKPVRDNDEGKLCALIRVVTALADLEIRSDGFGIVKREKHAGELWLYVPYGARQISFSHEGYFPLLYQYALPIDEGTVYELYLVGFETNTDAVAQNSNAQLFVLNHYPDEAQVYIDGIEIPSENGVYASMMSKGEHTYKVVADQYEDAEGTFELNDQPVRETVSLSPLFATMEIRTQPKSGFDVYLNNQRVGASPYISGKMKPGKYKITLKDKNKDYYPLDTIIRVREGDNIVTTIDLKDRHVWDDLLGGRDVSLGVHAGYVMPFVSSSASGGFTGSPMNYSFGDSRENVNYSSQSGFAVDVMADIRLYKNFYLMAGLNYTHVKYANKFNEPITNDIVSINAYDASVGDRANNFEEKYTVNLLELPILASYRFVFNRNNSLHLNLGPYLSYGLSSKMKFSGSSDCSGNIYLRKLTGDIDYSTPTGTFTQNHHFSGDFDLYSTSFDYVRTVENTQGVGENTTLNEKAKASPYTKFNYGLKFGAVYEIRGFQIGLSYNLQLSNMANKDFWESTRIPVFTKTGTNNMSGYKQKIHYLELKVGYVFRY